MLRGDVPAWHSLPAADVLKHLDVEDDGLSPAEARMRLQRHGPNVLREDAGPSRVALLARQFTSPITLVLVIAAVLTLVLGDFVDAGVILGVLALNAAIGYFQEKKAENSVRALANMVALQAHVIRGGREWLIPSAELVPGDIVLLESGSKVPADLRLLTTTWLSIDESLLTGESNTVGKQADDLAVETPAADRANMAFAGTAVSSGRGRGVVVATGEATVVGGIADTMRREKPLPTPLQRRMSGFARLVGIGVALLAFAAFGIGVSRGETAAEMFRVAVAMAVSAVPEGLPVAFTITLALGVRRMASRNAIVRHLPAVETLGSANVIGSDKTGTLTENRMAVQRVWTADQEVALEDPALNVVPTPALRLTLLAGVLANEAEVFLTENGMESTGDPTEVALLVSAAGFGIEHEQSREAYPSIVEIPFEAINQYSGSVRREGEGSVLYVKGAPERVLDMCTRMLAAGGETELDRDSVNAAAEGMARRGLRVLAMAQSRLAQDPRRGEQMPPPKQMVFLGLQGMMDPPRAGVREAIASCQSAGIRVVMITGDHAATALAIGAELGIASAADHVVTGAELETIDDDQLKETCEKATVYARVTPNQKLRVVHALQANGHVVAVTGDGVNDAPALKAADIGIAMGKSGTDVAREAADMVLADDNFVSIYAAVEEGRVTFDNVRKVTFFLVSTGVAELIAIITALTFGWPLPFLAVQILWLNLVTTGLQDVALAFEPKEPDILKQPPRGSREGLLSRLVWERTIVAGVVMAAGTLVLFRWELDRGSTEAAAQTTALTTMVLFQTFHVGNSRAERQSAFRRNPFSNPFLFICTAAALGVHIAALYLPFTQYVLRFEPVSLEAWLRIIPIAATVIIAVEAHKLIRGRKTAA